MSDSIHRPLGYPIGSSTPSSQPCTDQSGTSCCRGNTFESNNKQRLSGIRIGADAMLHLLLKTSLFISLPNGCLCQLTGEPLIFASLPPGGGFLDSGPHHRVLKRKRETPQQLQPRKRLRLIRTITNYREQSIKPSTKRIVSQPIQR